VGRVRRTSAAINLRRRVVCGVDDRIEPLVGHQLQHRHAQRLAILHHREITGIAGRLAHVLDQPARAPRIHGAGEEDLLQRPHRRVRVLREVRIRRFLGLEVVPHTAPRHGRHAERIDQHRPLRTQVGSACSMTTRYLRILAGPARSNHA
jgi:hypothetical protein